MHPIEWFMLICAIAAGVTCLYAALGDDTPEFGGKPWNEVDVALARRAVDETEAEMTAEASNMLEKVAVDRAIAKLRRDLDAVEAKQRKAGML